MNTRRVGTAAVIAAILLTVYVVHDPSEVAAVPQVLGLTVPAWVTKTSAPAQPGAHAAPASGVTPADWRARFDKANDYLRFVKEALPAAQAGDGRAAFYIAAALHQCPLDAVAAGLQLPQRCLGLAKEGVPGDHDSTYWFAQALGDGDPLAQADAARGAVGDVMADPQMPGNQQAAKLKIAQDYLRAAVASGDLDALWSAGQTLSSPVFAPDTLRGVAVALASCELGRDCSANNPEDPAHECVVAGTCSPNGDYAYMLQQSLGQERYAQVNTQMRKVVQAERAGDTQAVLEYLTIDKHP